MSVPYFQLYRAKYPHMHNSYCCFHKVFLPVYVSKFSSLNGLHGGIQPLATRGILKPVARFTFIEFVVVSDTSTITVLFDYCALCIVHLNNLTIYGP